MYLDSLPPKGGPCACTDRGGISPEVCLARCRVVVSPNPCEPTFVRQRAHARPAPDFEAMPRTMADSARRTRPRSSTIRPRLPGVHRTPRPTTASSPRLFRAESSPALAVGAAFGRSYADRGKALAGKNHFDIRLHPPELGRSEVQLKVGLRGPDQLTSDRRPARHARGAATKRASSAPSRMPASKRPAIDCNFRCATQSTRRVGSIPSI